MKLINTHTHCYLEKSMSPIRHALASALCLSILLISNYSYAQGIEAGTSIQNIATAIYTVDSIVQEPIESSPTGNSTSGTGNGESTEFVVDRKVDLLVTGNTNANVAPGDSQAEVTFTLQNQGNAIQEFSLSTDYLLTADNYDVNNCNVEVTGVNGIPITGVVLPTTGDIKLFPDQQASISVRCDIPSNNSGSPILTGQTSLLGLIATVERNDDGTNTLQFNNTDTPNAIDTVFADDAGTDDSSTDGSHSARRTYIAASSTSVPTLTMNKTIFSVLDPDGGSSAITGSEVTYKIQINTGGIGTIENLIITDPTPVDMTYKTNSISLNTTIQTDLSDADNTDFGISATNTATINLGNFIAGNQHEILITYIIN
ncbi:MAG: hypothetical protein ACI88H_003786 [Cocleimonas sp.]|jgi:hypothetical protein